MLVVIRDWYRRNFSDPQAVILAILLLGGLVAILTVGDLLAPFLVAVVLAYVLEGVVQGMQRWGIPRLLAVSTVLVGSILLAVMALFVLAPILVQQGAQLLREAPDMIARGQSALRALPELYPALVTEEQIRAVIRNIQTEVGDWGRALLSVSLAQAVSVFAFFIYLVLVPLMVFFLLKDKDSIVSWLVSLLPERRELSSKVWLEVNEKIGNYIRGKVIEIIIVWAVSYVTFTLFGLNFSLLLSFLVGISVIIPYIGAIAVTIPIALVAYFQWGFAAEFWWLLIAYQIIQILDGNVLVPILFSEMVNLHPVAIIVAVLFFGGLWGVWGIFFAIPLATLIQVILNTWPHAVQSPEEVQAEADAAQAEADAALAEGVEAEAGSGGETAR